MPAAPAEEWTEDRIELRGLRVQGTHGVLEEERQRAQPFRVDVDAYLDTAPAAGADRLGDTVDYSALAHAVVELVGGERSFELLESLADALAWSLLGLDERLVAVAVSIHKLRPPVAVDLETAGVRVLRRRGVKA